MNSCDVGKASCVEYHFPLGNPRPSCGVWHEAATRVTMLDTVSCNSVALMR